MFRVFFGLFAMATPTDWWNSFSSDNNLPQFQWGKSITIDTHVIRPVKRHRVAYNYPPNVYDEYIDLYTAQPGITEAEMFGSFVNQGGVATTYPLVSSATNGSIHNVLEIDSDLSEWIQTGTRLLSEPYSQPITSDPVELPEFVAVNETLENNPSLSVAGYTSFTACVKSGTSYGYCKTPCIVPYHSTGDTIRLVWMVPVVGTITKIVVYRADVEQSATRQEFLNWPQWSNWRVLRNHSPIVEITPSTAGTLQTVSAALISISAYPYPTPTATNWAVFPPINNALSRMNLAWQRRVTSVYYQPLVIHAESLTYWKGYLVKLSPVFQLGTAGSADNAAAFTLAITEHGTCSAEALDAPNTSGNFTPVTRSL